MARRLQHLLTAFQKVEDIPLIESRCLQHFLEQIAAVEACVGGTGHP